jgi:alpha-tubulin suppressor-like RCC1 family protein
MRYIGRTLAPILAAGLLIAALGCREDAESPTAPEPAPELATTAAALAFYQVSAGGRHSCGVTTDNRAYCWGAAFNGQLGNGTTTWRLRPVAVAGTLRFRQVSAAANHTCAVTTDYRAYCWGSNTDGKLGDGTETDRLRPVPVAGGLRFRQVDGGDDQTCAVTYPDNRAYCWGYHAEGGLGDGTFQPRARLTPTAVAGGLRFRQVSTGGGQSNPPRGEPFAGHSCGVTTTDEAFCWGPNTVGQLGIGGTTGSWVGSPTRVAGAHRFRQIEVGSAFTCAVTTTNRAFCWGYGRQGQIGDGKTYLRFSPSAVAGGHSFSRVTTGGLHTCGETTLNRAYCWGSTGLGAGTIFRSLTPVAVAGGLFFSQVSAGGTEFGAHTCGKTAAGVAYCWGENTAGQLGDGTTTNRNRPTPVLGPT